MTFPRLRAPRLAAPLALLALSLPLAAAQPDAGAAGEEAAAQAQAPAVEGAAADTSAQDAADAIRMEVEILRVDRARDDGGSMSERFVPVSEAVPGDLVEYRVRVVHEGDAAIPAGVVVVSVPIGEGVAYVEGSAGPLAGDEVLVDFSADGGATFGEPPLFVGDDVARPEAYDAIRWTFLTPLEPGDEHVLFYRVEVL